MLGTMVEKATTMVAALQQIHDEQQDCLYKLEVVAVSGRQTHSCRRCPRRSPRPTRRLHQPRCMGP
jgi:hypothetical protein